MTKIKIFKAVIFKTTIKDDYNEGEIGEGTDHGKWIDFEEKSIQALLEKIQYFAEVEVYRFENRIEFDRWETIDGMIPTKHGIDLWKRGEKALYSARFEAFISEVTIKDFDDDDIRHFFCDLKSIE